MAYNQMLARHHQGTQKIVISDNIFVTGKKKKVVMGKLSMESASEYGKFLSAKWLREVLVVENR